MTVCNLHLQFKARRKQSLGKPQTKRTLSHGCAQACCKVIRCTSFAGHHHDHENERFSAGARAAGTTRSADAKQAKCVRNPPLQKSPLICQALKGCQHRDTRGALFQQSFPCSKGNKQEFTEKRQSVTASHLHIVRVARGCAAKHNAALRCAYSRMAVKDQAVGRNSSTCCSANQQ